MGIKKSEIALTSNDDTDYQVVVRGVCVTDAFKTKDAAYKDYIKRLIDVVENVADDITKVKTF